MTIDIQNIAKVREELMQKYLKGVITSEEMAVLNEIEDQTDLIIQQRKSERIIKEKRSTS